MQIIKDGNIVTDDWTHLSDDDTPPESRFTVSLKRWLRDRDTLTGRGHALGLRVKGEDAPTEFLDDLPRFQLVCIDMPSMTDGRGFSLARLLRERYGFTGELRVRGEFIRDQMFFLSRVGVNAFEFAAGADLSAQLPALQDFTVKYQAATDERQPLYRRR